MEAFESLSAYTEVQTHGFEVDLLAARGNRLVLATVKSAFGSRGVVAEHVTGESSNLRANKLYALLNNETVRDAVVLGAAQRFGYQVDQVELRLYVGRFAAPTTGTHEAKIRQWCAEQKAGSGPIGVFNVREVVAGVIRSAQKKQYRNNPVLVTMKALEAAGLLKLTLPDHIDDDLVLPTGDWISDGEVSHATDQRPRHPAGLAATRRKRAHPLRGSQSGWRRAGLLVPCQSAVPAGTTQVVGWPVIAVIRSKSPS
ncbi:hypothetical protein [Micromonospora sagamiensis]|uniref:Restriction endonuclease n=1 Tax=Micromonospora sagamiensis TaxID=47875 RepID=A0A562WQV1_9ACTN|nr:hypothetical protein [Micromonospora sagamiensis]TWJ31764.1 hypothetical protein JD81_05325 [Micromonospora sagamiensis]BCL15182.1 hypothetical protein GCM10017556_29210 [Micromonospora sagamiensis]